MPRRNISLPDDLDAQARDAGLNVSALARQAIVAELDRRARMAQLDAWLDSLDEQHGPPSDRAMRAARRWADRSTPVATITAVRAAPKAKSPRRAS